MNETPNISIMRKSLFLETITRIREILVTSNELLCQRPSQNKKTYFGKVKLWTSDRQRNIQEKREAFYDLLENCKLPTNCLSVFDHFVGLVLKGWNTFNSYFSIIVKDLLRQFEMQKWPSGTGFYKCNTHLNILKFKSFIMWWKSYMLIILRSTLYPMIRHKNKLFS